MELLEKSAIALIYLISTIMFTIGMGIFVIGIDRELIAVSTIGLIVIVISFIFTFYTYYLYIKGE